MSVNLRSMTEGSGASGVNIVPFQGAFSIASDLPRELHTAARDSRRSCPVVLALHVPSACFPRRESQPTPTLHFPLLTTHGDNCNTHWTPETHPCILLFWLFLVLSDVATKPNLKETNTRAPFNPCPQRKKRKSQTDTNNGRQMEQPPWTPNDHLQRRK